MTEISQADIKIFIELFSGRRNAYGSFTVTGTGDGGKIKGKAATVKSTLTDDIYVKHLKGEQGVGVIPIKENNKCSFAVIDIDTYTEEIKKRVIRIVTAFNMPLCLFTSKSGGIHAYLFFKEEVSTKFARTCMKRLRDLLGLPDNTEVFPKQEKTDDSSFGNWINLPYFGTGPSCVRNLLNEQGLPVHDLTQAMSQCSARKVTEEDINAFFESIPLQDAPPCLQQLYVTNQVSDRNNYLFSLGVYFKAKYGEDKAEKELIRANERLPVPVTLNELTKTVLASMHKKDYSYMCEEPPLCKLCNAEECGRRKYGPGGKEVSKLSFGEFRQILSDPPSYEWEVNDQTLILETEDDIINQNGFRKQCARKLGVLPEKVSEVRWNTMINRALRNRVIVKVDPETDVSQGAVIRTCILEYVAKKSQMINTKSGILQGYVYYDDSMQLYIFDPKKLVMYLAGRKELQHNIIPAQFKEKMKELEKVELNYDIGEGQTIKCYGIPAKFVMGAGRKAARIMQPANFLDIVAGENMDF